MHVPRLSLEVSRAGPAGLAWTALILIAATSASSGWAARLGRAEDAPTSGSVERIAAAAVSGAHESPAEGVPARVFEARVVIEAVDGGLLVEHADERLELLQPAAILRREPLSKEAAAAWARVPPAERAIQRAESARLLAALPDGFECLFTRHYCICHDTSPGYARWCGGLLERLHGAFENYWSRGGVAILPRGRPLVVVIFRDRAAFATHAGDTLGAAAGRVAGYYDIMTNRIITYDLSGASRAGAGGGFSGSPGDLAMLRNPATAGLVATLVHEATHQMAFSSGIHRRLAPIPVWVSEGMACYFETPDLESTSGWKGIGRLNAERFARWRSAWRPGSLERIVSGDDAFRSAEEGLDAYACAWAFMFYLLQARREACTEYLGLLARKEPLGPDSPEQRLEDFGRAFRESPAEMEPAFVRFMARQQVSRP
jgi:hypothetical protein